jgi:hypothetical protein
MDGEVCGDNTVPCYRHDRVKKSAVIGSSVFHDDNAMWSTSGDIEACNDNEGEGNGDVDGKGTGNTLFSLFDEF